MASPSFHEAIAFCEAIRKITQSGGSDAGSVTDFVKTVFG